MKNILFLILLILFSSNSLAITYQYDDLNRLTLATYSDGSSVEYSYDPAGNITLVKTAAIMTNHTISGNVSGLASGNSVVLQNNSGDDLTVSANGTFAFPTALADGSAYAVSVLTQPTSPDQTCTVTNGNGTLAGADITNVAVNCVTDPVIPNTFAIGGSVAGLAAGNSVILQNNGGDNLSISTNGNFSFPTQLTDGSAYLVSVLTQPASPDQTCSIMNGSGTLVGSTAQVQIACVVNETVAPGPIQYTGNTATGTGTATASIDNGGGPNCGFDEAETGFVAMSSVSAPAPTDNEFVQGLFRFKLNQCNPASSVQITIQWPTTIPAGTEFWKFGPATAGADNTWFKPSSATIDFVNNRTTHTVVNNGEGDLDNDIHSIVDPVGLAFPAAAPPPPAPATQTTPVPTVSEWAIILLSSLMLMLGGLFFRHWQNI